MNQIRTEPTQAKTDCETLTKKSAAPELNLDDLKKNEHLLISPRALSRMTKSPSNKSICVCSPTNHVGSFRCRRHRTTALSRGGSVGSNLSNLSHKSAAMEGLLEGQ